jgi:death-on-curing family protein
MENKGTIVIYNPAEKGEKAIEVKLENETVWLSQKQLAVLFDKGIPTINEHIKNIFKEGELNEIATIRKFRIVQNEEGREIKREVNHYNLDVIISVGYRVSSIKGTQFRIWATKVLRDHIVKGYTINEKRLEELQKSISLIEKAEDFQKLSKSEAEGLLKVITEYTKSWILLNKYDNDDLTLKKTISPKKALLFEDCKDAIIELKKSLIQQHEASDLFGNEIESRFKAIIGNVNQSLYGKEVYPTIEEKAAHLLYFVIKDHPFSDGNKRIASMLFVYFIHLNDFQNKDTGEEKINDNTLVALALLVAVSNPQDKDNLIKLITNLLN